MLHLVTLGADLRERGIGLHVIEQGIDTSTTEGRAMVGMLSVLAELQRELIVANTNDGLPSARARGRVGGHRPKLTEDPAALAQPLSDQQEKTVKHIADMFGAPRSPVYGHPDKTKTVPRQPKTTALTKPWRSVSCTPLTRPCRADETVQPADGPGGRPLSRWSPSRPASASSPSSTHLSQSWKRSYGAAGRRG